MIYRTPTRDRQWTVFEVKYGPRYRALRVDQRTFRIEAMGTVFLVYITEGKGQPKLDRTVELNVTTKRLINSALRRWHKLTGQPVALLATPQYRHTR